MSGSFDDFERVMKKELELAVPTLFNMRSIEMGFDSDGSGGYSVEIKDVPNLTTAVVLDAVLLTLRRYHEWAEAR